MLKNIVTSAGIVLLSILGVQQIIINSHQIRVIEYRERCFDSMEGTNLEWWNGKDAKQKAGLINQACLGLR
jgi:hypothetical protein